MSDDILETLKCGRPEYNEETRNYETVITKNERLAIKEITRLRGEVEALSHAIDDANKSRGLALDEVERLTRERDYWARARNEWEKSAGLLEEENKRLTRERDAAIREAVRYQQERDAVARRLERALEEGAKRREERAAAVARAEAAERERDWHKSLTQSHDLLADNAALKARADAAEAKVAELAKEVAEWRSRPDALRADKAEAKVAKLREALKPFAEAASMTADGFPDHDIMPMRLGQCRDARTALQETEQ